MWQGYELIGYSMADAKPEAVRPWVDVPGLGFAAREYALTPINDSSDDETIRKRRNELVGMLERRPLSSYDWLELAESRIDAEEAPAKAVEALQLSEVTGPNEGYLIAQRGFFGIWQWEVLPPNVQRRAVADLMVRHLSDRNLDWLRTTLSEKTEQIRQEIRLALQAQGFPEGNFARIGL